MEVSVAFILSSFITAPPPLSYPPLSVSPRAAQSGPHSAAETLKCRTKGTQSDPKTGITLHINLASLLVNGKSTSEMLTACLPFVARGFVPIKG